ncbi:metal ABC transporter solute-binding protein, Zn/Mn family [Euhalothece natronophila]|nr:zinc ABC transporter substrate-binding protein [Euhalothece natronophila]
MPNRLGQRLPLILASAFALGLASCEPNDLATNGADDVDEAEDLTIVTTFIPMTNFTKAVVGDRAEVEQLLPPESGAHHYQGTPGDVQMLANADVLVKNGLDMEFFLEDTIDSADNPDLHTIDTSQGIAALTWDEIEAAREIDADDHDHDNGHSHDHDHDHENSHDHDNGHSHDDNHHDHENSHDHDNGHSHDDNHHDHENSHDHDNGHSHDDNHHDHENSHDHDNGHSHDDNHHDHENSHDHDNGHSHDDNHHDHENDHDHDNGHSHDDNHHDHENSHDHDNGHSHDDNHHDHENSHDHDNGHDHTHDHDNGHSHSHDHGDYDPHIWLDPKRAIQQVENIRDGLIEVDPAGEEVYTENAAAYIEELEALDEELSEKLSPYAGQTFVVFHDLANYFADSYDLRSEYLVGVPAENPSPDDVRRVMDTVTEYNIQAVLTEPQAEEGFSALADDLDITVSVFDPIETGDSDSLEPEYYLTTMRQNVENLANTFEATEQSHLPLNIIPHQERVSYSKEVESPQVIVLGFQEK